MLPVVTADEMRALDRAAIDQLGIPAFTLMETAGRAVAAVAMAMSASGPIVVVCGPGNNGGDGFVVARVLRARGLDAVVVLAAPREKVQGDALAHLKAYEATAGLVIEESTWAARTPDAATDTANANASPPGFVTAKAQRTPRVLLGGRTGWTLESSATGVATETATVGATEVVAVAATEAGAVPVPEAGTVPEAAASASASSALVAIANAALVVDALFGIGPVRPLDEHLTNIVGAINRARQVLSIDIPSGLDADTGVAHGVAVRATRTIAMGALKVALVSSPGFAQCGVVEVAEIGIPVTGSRAALVERSDVLRWLPQPGVLDHKGRRGHVLVVSGAPAMRGAGRLAALGALRAGAGLVTLAGDGEVEAPDSVMTTAFAADNLKDVVVIGPGLGQSAVAAERVRAVLASGVPAVLDADALNVVTPDQIAAAVGSVVITPHPGEAARLLGTTTAAIERDRFAAVRSLAQATGAVVVLKGARTLVCDGTLGDDHVAVNPTGSPALATAGSGDVLAGVVGALLAQGVAAGDAARAAVYVHGSAGAALEPVYGRGTISSDLPTAIAREIAALTMLQDATVNVR